MDSDRFDRLSSLPESLVIEILSRMKSMEAAATSVLSRQWRFVLTNLGSLELKEKRRFVWTQLGQVEVEENSKLEDFVNTMIAVEWPWLKSLSLWEVRISAEKLEKLVSRCPLLESLELRKCRDLYRVVVGNPSVRRLRVDTVADEMSLKITISAPYIRELEVFGTPVRVLDASNLDRATIGISWYCSTLGDCVLEKGALFLLQDIRHVNELRLPGSTASLLSRMAAECRCFRLEEFRLQNLALCVWSDAFHIHGIIALLRSSPNIHSLELHNFPLELSIEINNEGTLDCDEELLHLKFVRIAFVDNITVKLAQIILEKAPSLEEMVFFKSKNSPARDFIQKCQPLHHYPRSSRKAKLVILQ